MIKKGFKKPKSNSVLKIHVKPLVRVTPSIPTKAQTKVVFKIVKRSIIKNAKCEGRKISSLELREKIHEMMSKWPSTIGLKKLL